MNSCEENLRHRHGGGAKLDTPELFNYSSVSEYAEAVRTWLWAYHSWQLNNMVAQSTAFHAQMHRQLLGHPHNLLPPHLSQTVLGSPVSNERYSVQQAAAPTVRPSTVPVAVGKLYFIVNLVSFSVGMLHVAQ